MFFFLRSKALLMAEEGDGFSFPDWEAYERYRAEAGDHDECKRATKIANETRCFTSYERCFLTPVLDTERT